MFIVSRGRRRHNAAVPPHLRTLLCAVLLLTCTSKERDGHAPMDASTDDDATNASASVAAVDRPLALSVLVFTRTSGFRHESIDDAREFFESLSADQQLSIELSEDPTLFSDAGLSRFDVVVFVNTTGDVLDDTQQQALQSFVRSGRGFVGVHAAADTEHDWPWYGELVGGYFVSHPEDPLEATLRVDPAARESRHQSIVHLDDEFRFNDEWYNFDRNPRDEVDVLLTVDESDFTVPNTPPGPSMGDDHPVAWSHTFDGGRSFYTNLGHRPQTWEDERFQQHLLEGIRWAAGGGYTARSLLTDDLKNPLAIAERPDGSIYIIERTGVVRLWRPDTGAVVDALTLEVDTGYENGLLGLAVDPDHDENGYAYFYVSEPRISSEDRPGPPGLNSVVRFTAREDGTLDPDSRVRLLSVPSERRCCHEGGALAFAADGTLFVSTGDNTNPFESEGMAPLDERPGRETADARRTAANPHDLRGKILRINSDGSVPAGNLFTSEDEGLPQIYAMGVRNPFRIAPDPETSRLFFGDVGPDAESDTERGPRGLDEINVADAPGDYGWPLCIGDNLPYVSYDYSSLEPGEAFDCAGKRGSLMAYDYATPTYEALGIGYDDDGKIVGRTAIAGAVYRAGSAAKPFPPRFSGGLIMTEWTRDVLALVDVNEAGSLVAVDRVFANHAFKRPIDVEVSSDGALLVLEYGSEFWGDNADARLTRLEYGEPRSLPPVAQIDASRTHGSAPLDVVFTAADSRASAGQEIVSYAWDVGADGSVEHTEATVEHRFERTGEYLVSLVVTSEDGKRSQPVATRIVVGNTAPQVQILSPLRGARLSLGAPVTLVGQGMDHEDGEAACEDLEWNIGLIHNAHSHPLWTLHGCTTQFIAEPEDHDPEQELLSFSIELVYTDNGGPRGESPLTARQGLQFELVP